MGGTAPSIMDYARYNYVAQPGDGVTAITPKIGIYDKYAINWGYRWYPKKSVEKKALRQLIQQHEGDPMYFFGAQQSYKNIVDPRSQSEDLGNNAMKASQYGLKNLKIVVDSIIPWTYEEDHDFYEAGKLYMGAIGQWQMYNMQVMANIGGIYLNHARYGNGIEAHTPVPYATQKEAVDYLITHVIHLPKWLFFDEVNLKTYPVKDSPLGPYEHSPYALARELQYSIIYYTLMDERLLRLLDAEVMSNQQIDEYPEKVYTVHNLFEQLRQAIFKPTQKRQALTILERMAEKNYVDALIIDVNKLFKKTRRSGLMITQNLQMPELCQVDGKQLQYIDFDAMKRVSEVTTYKKTELMRIKKLVEKRKNTGDEATQAHYLDLINRINEALGI